MCEAKTPLMKTFDDKLRGEASKSNLKLVRVSAAKTGRLSNCTSTLSNKILRSNHARVHNPDRCSSTRIVNC